MKFLQHFPQYKIQHLLRRFQTIRIQPTLHLQHPSLQFVHIQYPVSTRPYRIHCLDHQPHKLVIYFTHIYCFEDFSYCRNIRYQMYDRIEVWVQTVNWQSTQSSLLFLKRRRVLRIPSIDELLPLPWLNQPQPIIQRIQNLPPFHPLIRTLQIPKNISNAY